MKINKYIDHTLLKTTATKQDIIDLCNEAKRHHFAAVCVNGSYVELAKEHLKDSLVKVVAVVGFPLGMTSTKTKVFEASQCIKKGADEIDMVINIGRLKSNDLKYVEHEIFLIKKELVDKKLKVILETCYLTSEEIITACELAVSGNADFVKTSTGFGPKGATFKDVKLMLDSVEGHTQVKASGGIKDLETALKYIQLGVTRLGTSSGVSLVTSGTGSKNNY